jgi:two-component system alkaline phosphatase synthesis response regulator PhoP
MDVMMPVMDGMEACRQLKDNPETKNIPVIFLTARSEEFAELAGFEAGADDYIAKPVRNRVLLSRVKAILRRGNAIQTPEPEKYDFGTIKIDRERFVVEYNEKALQLPRKEFELLAFLASRPGRVFARSMYTFARSAKSSTTNSFTPSKVWATNSSLNQKSKALLLLYPDIPGILLLRCYQW